MFILKPQHQNRILQGLIELSRQIKYHNTDIAPNLQNMEDWEAK
ncbi:hypothetical protein [Tenacibaculum phage Larrie]|nr:hypothetical protein [Tenacibaculum phage Larrie]